MGAGLGAMGSTGMSPARAVGSKPWHKPRGFDVGLLSLSLSLEP